MNNLNKLDIKNQNKLIRFSWIIPIIAWVALYIYRPFFLGFYHDDWSILIYMPLKFYPEHLSHIYSNFPNPEFYYFINFYSNRPLTGLVSWFLSTLCHDSPFKWHCAVIIANLVTAFSIRLLVRSFLALINENKLYLGDFAATLWLVFPWSMAINTWPTLIPNQLTIICFSLSGYFLFSAWKDNRIGWFRPALFFLLSCLSYESFYGQFIIYIMIGFIYEIHKKNGILALVLPFLSYSFIQIFVVIFNRLGGVFIQHSVKKTLYEDWYHLWLSSLQNLPEILLESLTIFKSFFIVTLAIGAFIVIFACIEEIVRHSLKENKSLFQAILALVTFMLGGIIAVAIYSIAGYAMLGVGLESRVTLSLSYWMTLMLVPIALIVLNSRQYINKVGVMVALSGLLCMGGATTMQLQSWIKSWDIQQEIIASAPLNEIQKAKSNAFIVLKNYPPDYKGVTIFKAEYDIGSAMKYSHSLPSTLRFLLQNEPLITTWDGQAIQQSSPGHWNLTYDADEVWLWNFQNRSFRKANPPFQIP